MLDYVTGLEMSTCQYVADLLYVRNFACGGYIDGHLWSLSVEEQFYLIWPAVVAFAVLRWRWRTAVAMIMLAPIARVAFYVAGYPHLLMYSFFAHMDALMIGCIAALISRTYQSQVMAVLTWRPMWGRLTALAVIYAVLVAQKLFLLPELILPLGPSLQATAAVYLIASYAFVERGVGYRFLNLRPIAYIGVLSYSLYIWQQPFFARADVFGLVDAPLLLTFPYNLIAAFATAALSYHALEMPLLGLRARMRKDRILETTTDPRTVSMLGPFPAAQTATVRKETTS